MQKDYPVQIDLIEPRKEWRNQQQINESFAVHHKISTEIKSFSKAALLGAVFKLKFWQSFFHQFNLRESIRGSDLFRNNWLYDHALHSDA